MKNQEAQAERKEMFQTGCRAPKAKAERTGHRGSTEKSGYASRKTKKYFKRDMGNQEAQAERKEMFQTGCRDPKAQAERTKHRGSMEKSGYASRKTKKYFERDMGNQEAQAERKEMFQTGCRDPKAQAERTKHRGSMEKSGYASRKTKKYFEKRHEKSSSVSKMKRHVSTEVVT